MLQVTATLQVLARQGSGLEFRWGGPMIPRNGLILFTTKIYLQLYIILISDIDT